MRAIRENRVNLDALGRCRRHIVRIVARRDDVHLRAIPQSAGDVVRVRPDAAPGWQELGGEEAHPHADSSRFETEIGRIRRDSIGGRFRRRIRSRQAIVIPVRRGTSFGSPTRQS